MIGRGLKSSSSTGASEGWITFRGAGGELFSAVDDVGTAGGTGGRAASVSSSASCCWAGGGGCCCSRGGWGACRWCWCWWKRCFFFLSPFTFGGRAFTLQSPVLRNRQHLASDAKISRHFIFFSFHQKAPCWANRLHYGVILPFPRADWKL